MDALQVLAQPTRRRILALVWEDEMAASEIAARFDVTFGAVSQHLGVLREAGFVRRRSVGNQRLYRAAKDRLGPFRAILEAMWTDTLDDLARAVEEAEEEGAEE
jgi:DNA-binding transcriptional ArsR family regulator